MNLNKARYNISKHNRFAQEVEELYNFGASWAWCSLQRSRSCVITHYVAWRHRGRQLRRRLGLMMVRSWLVKEVYFHTCLLQKWLLTSISSFSCCIFLHIWQWQQHWTSLWVIQQHNLYDLQSLTSVDDFSWKSCKFHNSENKKKCLSQYFISIFSFEFCIIQCRIQTLR